MIIRCLKQLTIGASPFAVRLENQSHAQFINIVHKLVLNLKKAVLFV